MSADYRYQECAEGITIEAHGKTFEQVCEQAAIGMFGIMAHPATILPERAVEIDFPAIDPRDDALTWLHRLLAQSRFLGLVFCSARLERVPAGWHGVAWGMPWRPGAGCGPVVAEVMRTHFQIRLDDGIWRLTCVAKLWSDTNKPDQ